MRLGLNRLMFWKRVYHEKSVDGTNWYYDDALFSGSEGNLDLCLKHPIITPAILFITRLMCQAEIVIKVKNSNERIYEHDVISLIEDPNPMQTRDDFITEIEFQKIANGVAIIYKKKGIGLKVDSLYVLDKNCFVFDDGEEIDTNKIIYRSEYKEYLETNLVYNDGFKEFNLKMKDLIFIKDVPYSKETNIFNVTSRVDGLKQTLINTKDSLIAKNIILKSNGKEMITAGKSGMGSFPFSPEEKKRVEGLMNNKYGVSFSRLRTIVSQTNLSWKSMHIALRDLGLDDSTKVDANIVFTALHIPKDIMSLEAKKTTYNNFKESMTSFIQNNIQQETDYIYNTIYESLTDNRANKISSSFRHMPIMKYILKEEYEGVKARGEALESLRRAGVPDELALMECGFDEKTELRPYKKN